jgi:hypothetical protein
MTKNGGPKPPIQFSAKPNRRLVIKETHRVPSRAAPLITEEPSLFGSPAGSLNRAHTWKKASPPTANFCPGQGLGPLVKCFCELSPSLGLLQVMCQIWTKSSSLNMLFNKELQTCSKAWVKAMPSDIIKIGPL